VFLALTLAGCAGGDEPIAGAASGLDTSWVATVAMEPARFAAAVEPARESWAALHRNDLGTAMASQDATVARRAADTLATLHRVLADVSDRAFLALGTTWERQGGLPADSHVNVVVAAAAARDASAATWLGRARAAFPSPADWPAGSSLDPELQARWAAAQAPCDATTDLPAVQALGGVPFATEAAVGATRTFWDPWIHRCLAEAFAARRDATPAPDGLRATLFTADLGQGTGSVTGDLATLGLPVPTTDDPQACRDLARGFDTVLDAQAGRLAGQADDDGAALLHDLRLAAVLRSDVLVSLAVSALDADAPQCALVYAELGRDHENGRAVSAVNSPVLFAVLASANLRTGHTREALDALEVLVGPFPEVHGLDETLGDLAILQGLHRTGDSREN
jgi:alkylhydroperoxidase/carboxymuconolactone decarboxylase family protein YurZ